MNLSTAASVTIYPLVNDIENNILNRTFNDTIEIYILSICFIIGAPLNLISFYKLLSKFCVSRKKARTGRRNSISGQQINYLRIHLNIAGLLILFAYTLPQIGWLFTTQWYGGNILCKIIKFFYTFVFYLTSFVIVCIAIDRVYGAYNISTFEVSKKAFRRCRQLLIAAYILAFLFSLPQFFIFGVVSPFDAPEFQQCAPIWMSIKFELQHQANSFPDITEIEKRKLWLEHVKISKWEKIYNICHLLFVFWIPALIIIVSYIYIVWILDALSNSRQDCMKTFQLHKILNCCQRFFKSKQEKRNPLTSSIQSKENRDEEDNVSNYELPNKEENKNDSKNIVMVEINKSPRLSGVDRYKSSAVSSARSSLDFKQPLTRVDAKLGLMALHTIAIAKHKTKRQATFIVIAYLTLWTPYNLFAIINIFVLQENRNVSLNAIMEFTPFLNSLIVINAIVNPIIYGIFDKKYE